MCTVQHGANPSQAHVVAGSLSGKGIFQALKKVFAKGSTKMLRRMEKSCVLASLEGQIFLMKKLKALKRSRWSLEEENLI